MTSIIQCVPNFSEGRNPYTVEAIVQAAAIAPTACVVDYSSDPDHNRMVVTLLGDPQGIKKAIFESAKRAIELIDLRKHTGAHPRIGAVDVIPLVPIKEITMEDCVKLSYEIGREIAEKLCVPVYFYEYSALTPARRNLAYIRRGGYESLRDNGISGERAPDLGPHQVHPSAGATAIGARDPLVAYNVNLETTDMEVCRSIVNKVREEMKPYGVKAIAVWLATRSQAQVSMNLTKPELTPLKMVYQFVEAEARKYGIDIAESEIIGVISSKVLDGTDREAIKAFKLKDSQILENWL
jgi:glutamate formiminotransferase